MTGIYFLICLVASTVGAVCGMGGGVIIKPVLDFFQIAGVSTISFLSGCTVLAMSCYTVGRNLLARQGGIDVRLGTPLALGAVAGGVAGGTLFAWTRQALGNENMAGAVQAGCLLVLTLFTLVYTLNKDTIRTRRVATRSAAFVIGCGLGAASRFLGIGGGPINLVVLFYFFSMDIITAAANSLYIILFGHLANLIATLASGSTPPFIPAALAAAVAGGVCGGIVGRILHRRISRKSTEKLFLAVMIVIICICLFNVWNLSASR